MAYEQGVSDWRLYSAEQSFGADEPMRLKDMQVFVDAVTTSHWWGETFPHIAPITVELGGGEPGEFISSYAYAVGSPTPERHVISMHPRMLSIRLLIHELAHCASPRVWGDPQKIRAGSMQDDGDFLSHGPMFTATLAALTEHLVPVAHDSLLDAFEHFEVPVAASDELNAAVLAEPDIYAAQEHRARDWEKFIAAADSAFQAQYGAPPPEGSIPEILWGEWLYRMRRQKYHRGRKVRPLRSQRAIADSISQVYPCTARDVAVIERLRERPDDNPDQLKRAMLAAIAIGVDPMWLRYQPRLTRWDCGDITMDEARTLNPRWADLVDKMNTQLAARPAHWDNEGSR